MSTRSGKRIHGSFHENEVKVDGELVAKSERKTRSRRLKENDEVVMMPKTKKRNNYVSYPTDDEVVDTMTTKNTNGDVSIKETLKEQDLNVSSTLNTTNDTGKVIRQTRRTKKISENIIEDAPVPEVAEKVKGKKKGKKNKKKMEEPGIEVNENDNPPTIPKKLKKKKGKNANPFKEEIIEPEINNLNKSNGSQDSFHSAAGSPLKENCITEVPEAKSQRALKRLKADSCEDLEEACLREEPDRKIKKVKLTNLNNSEANNRSLRSKEKENPENKDATFDKSHETLDGSILKQTQEKRRSSIKNSTFDKTDTPSKINKKFNSTFEKTNSPTPKKSNKPEEASSERKSLRSLAASKSVGGSTLNCTFEKESTLNNTVDKSKNSTQSKLNSTFDKSNDSKQSALNSTYEKHNDSSQSKFNSTFEKSTDTKGSRMNSTFEKSNNAVPLNSTFEKRKSARQSLNTTFEKTKDSTQPNLNSTFDKEINSTYEKTEDKLETSKSSLISSDNTSNVTLDKSNENSRISITSDDSRTENIVNTTPLLIESSLDESQIRDPTPKKTDDKEASLKTSTTPLKREGTFTKDSPDVMSKPTNGTPVKRMSLPSPGSTPFPFSKSGQKEKSMMNVTRSIEKATRRASLAETAQRQTRVMFCSPVNNPVVAMQQKKKVIKSSMKGSNKSFLFDESASEAVRPAARKRSYTQNDADDVRSKRKRLADPQQHSVDRLSRPRTCSATVKLSEPSTPSKKPTTPLRKVLTPRGASEAKPPRTKLPNFAALHQKQFDKMESLGECQQRRARRARALLTPSGAPNIIEKSSPKIKATATEPVKAVKEVAKKTDTPTKTPKLPTLMSLRPGYTRFGFKMHLDDNPFSIPPKTEKPKEKKPNGALIRQPSQPSLTGATVSRREVAKQTVMREKSFTSLSDKRNVTRKENRSVIKGVRTNRRFELQMKMRNINS